MALRQHIPNPAAHALPDTASWLDVSVPIRTGMVHWPDNPPVEVSPVMHVDRGDICSVSRLQMGSHTGTHVDAPVHFLRGGAGVDKLPLDSLMGPARVIAIDDRKSVKKEELLKHKIQSEQRLLFKTANSERCWNTSDFVEDFISLTEEAASYLARLKTLVVGIDYLSVGGVEAHHHLLGAGVCIIEGLDLSHVGQGEYDLLCLPLNIPGCDGAPARVLLRHQTT